MNIFYTPSSMHFASSIKLPMGSCTIKKFSDGELYVRIDQDVQDQEVWVVAATNPPTENLFEFFFLLDALMRAGAIVRVLITYFGYARQDRAAQGEALSAQVISNFFNTFSLEQLCVIHIHNPAIERYLQVSNYIPYNFFYNAAQEVDVIVAPDKGAYELAKNIAQKMDKKLAHVDKKRINHDLSEVIELHGDVSGKKALIIDDMISTGGTVINAANALMDHGAQSVSVAATHGIFSDKTVDRLKKSVIQEVTVTNSIAQPIYADFVTVVDLSSFLCTIIEQN